VVDDVALGMRRERGQQGGPDGGVAHEAGDQEQGLG
jgi:hypothetical protein